MLSQTFAGRALRSRIRKADKGYRKSKLKPVPERQQPTLQGHRNFCPLKESLAVCGNSYAQPKEVVMRPNIGKAILGGFVGTLAITLMMYRVGPMMGPCITIKTSLMTAKSREVPIHGMQSAHGRQEIVLPKLSSDERCDGFNLGWTVKQKPTVDIRCDNRAMSQPLTVHYDSLRFSIHVQKKPYKLATCRKPFRPTSSPLVDNPFDHSSFKR